MSFEKQLKQLIRRDEISVAHLSKKTGISTKSLYHYLEGRIPRKLEPIQRLCEFFNVSADYLLFGVENKTNHPEKLLALGRYDVYLKKIPSVPVK